MSLADLRGALEPPRPLYLVYGDAGPLVHDAVLAIEEALLPKVGLPAFNHSTFRATESNAVDAFSAARTLPMMADLRLIVVRDMGDGDNAFFEALIAYAADPSPSSVVVVTGPRFPKVEKGGRNWATKVRNAIKKGGYVAQFTSKDVQPVRFAVSRAEGLAKRLSRRDAELLVELVGPDLGRLAQEVAKVALFVGEAEVIDGDAIEAACSVLAEAVIWDLTTGLAMGDAAQALGALHRLQHGGDDPRKLLGMITWQYRELLRVAELAAQGVGDQEMRKRTRMRWDLFKKVRPMMGGKDRASTFPHAAAVLERLARANMDMNSHRAGADRILETLVLEVLHGDFTKPERVSPRLR